MSGFTAAELAELAAFDAAVDAEPFRDGRAANGPGPKRRSDVVLRAVGARIGAHRRRLGISKAELGRRAGISGQSIGQYERGVVGPSIAALYDVARALGCEAEDLLRRGACDARGAAVTDTLLLAITIPGDPVAKERPRVNTRTGAVYTPRATKDAERTIGWAVKAAVSGEVPVAGLVAVDLVFRCSPRAGSLAKHQRQDADNLAKLVLDAVTGVIWEDDAQVVDVRARVIRDSDDPGTDIRVTAQGGDA